MSNLTKRILTSVLLLPFSFYFLILGGNELKFFLTIILLIGVYEVFNLFKKLSSKFYLLIILTTSLYSIYFLQRETFLSNFLLWFAISISISSDIGGYIFGKTFKWKKISKISPNKTLSGVIGSYLFSILTLVVFNKFLSEANLNISRLYFVPGVLLAVVFSTVSQLGDLSISYLKRKENIKDTGRILPGHGGIFDRIDGLMLVVILALIIYQFGHLK